MLPDVRESSEFDIVSYDTRTFKLNLEQNNISGIIDGMDALIQMVETILMTERYQWEIYSWKFGSELESLIGKNMMLVQTELKRRLTDALMQDDRIVSIKDFKFSKGGSGKMSLLVSFTAETIYGDLEREVSI